jgi:hypothetical protein
MCLFDCCFNPDMHNDHNDDLYEIEKQLAVIRQNTHKKLNEIKKKQIRNKRNKTFEKQKHCKIF